MNFFRKHPLLTLFFTAFLFRGIFALFYLSSPFRFFHTIPGLDMETLLRLGEWGTPDNFFFFTLHRLQVFLFWKLNSGVHPVMWHVLWQALLGIAGAVMLSDTALKLTGKKKLALCAGIIWALNPVELMYEFTTLQDSLVNSLILFSFWSFITARKHHFSPLFALGAGAAAGVASAGRPVAIGLICLLVFWILFYLYRRKLPLKRSFAFGGGILAVWLIFSAVNYSGNGTFTCFFNPVPYTLSFNADSAAEKKERFSAPAASAVSSSTLDRLCSTSFKMLARTPFLWNSIEIPENLNIYFLRQQIPLLRLPFEFIMLFASVGTLLLLFSGRWKKKEGLFLIPVFSLAFFLCVRDPIGRYRLLLLPWFTLIGVWSVFYCLAHKRTAIGCGLLFCVFVWASAIQSRPLRAADHFAWARALEKEAGKTTPEALKHFSAAFLMKPDPNNAVSLIIRAMKANNRSLAENSAAYWMEKSNYSSLSCYYAALAAFPDHRKMRSLLAKIEPAELPPRLRFRCYLMQGDAEYRLNDHARASIFYRKALLLPEGTPVQRRHAEYMLRKQGEKK